MLGWSTYVISLGAHVASVLWALGGMCVAFFRAAGIDHATGFRDKPRPTGRTSLVGDSPLWGVRAL